MSINSKIWRYPICCVQVTSLMNNFMKRSLTIRWGTAWASQLLVTVNSHTQLIDVMYVLGFWHWTIYLDDLTNPTTSLASAARCGEIKGNDRGHLEQFDESGKWVSSRNWEIIRMENWWWGVSNFGSKDKGWWWSLPHGLTQQIGRCQKHLQGVSVPWFVPLPPYAEIYQVTHKKIHLF